jgi:hypothetical protein
MGITRVNGDHRSRESRRGVMCDNEKDSIRSAPGDQPSRMPKYVPRNLHVVGSTGQVALEIASRQPYGLAWRMAAASAPHVKWPLAVFLGSRILGYSKTVPMDENRLSETMRQGGTCAAKSFPGSRWLSRYIPFSPARQPEDWRHSERAASRSTS